MWKSSALGACLLWTSLLNAGTPEGLCYKLHLQLHGESEPLEGRFRLLPVPALRTHNRVHPPRFGSWRLESKSSRLQQALFRVERLLYLSGPTPELSRRGAVIRYGKRLCPVWDVPIPSGSSIYAYLVEVEPGLLALSYLSGNFAGGEFKKVEIQLESVKLSRKPAPAQEGTVLLRTLTRLLMSPPQVETHAGEQVVYVDTEMSDDFSFGWD